LARGGYHQYAGCDVRGGSSRRVEGVVAGVGASHVDAGDGHRLGRAGVLVGEVGRGVRNDQDVTRHPIIRQRHGRSRGRVVHLVRGGGTNQQRPRGDVGRGGGSRGGQRVVGRVSAAQRQSADGHGLAIPHVLVGERGTRIRHAQLVTDDAGIRDADRGCRRAVVHLVLRRGRHGQRPGGDGGGRGGTR